jgi:CubicO group peptidase (beta-lactamase class C family)
MVPRRTGAVRLSLSVSCRTFACPQLTRIPHATMMHRYLRRLTLALVVALPGSTAIAQNGRFDLEKTKTVLSRVIEKTLADNGIPSMSIALVRGDSIVWKAAFGFANMRMRTPATTETLYSTGSSFKSVTATAIMQLAEQGKLALDDPINKYLGESQVKDQSDKPVTFTHILSHWSGLRNGAETQPIWGRKLPKTLEELTSALSSVRPPETKWEYNNFAYGTAGLLVQKISGVEYEQYMLDNILKPLGVTTPHPVYPSPDMVERMALPYAAGGSLGKPAPVAQVHFDVYPAGDIYLTAEDMARYLGAQINGGVFQGKRILSEASVREMHKARFGGDYGFGFWMVHDSATGHTLIHHGGAIAGQRAFLIGDLDAHVGVYYMTNSDYLPDATPPAQSEVVYAALELLRGENYVPRPQPKGIAVDEKVLDRYVGSYEAGRATIIISRVGRGLAIQQTGQPAKNELLAVTPVRFVQRGSPITITFEGDGGSIDRLVVEAGGRRQIATRRK